MKNFVLATIALLLSISLHSEEKRLALVIGNGNYGKNPLANPVNDAKSIEEALKRIGFEVQRYENLGQKEMARAIDDFGNRLRKYEVGLFFYAGHGLQAKGFNYLVPVDARLFSESDVEFNCVRADRVLGKMEDAKNKINIVILDACRDNPFERSWTRTARGQGLASMTAPVGSIIAFATSPGNTASDGTGKNGLFTAGLLTYIREPGITAIQMFQKVIDYVSKKTNNQQVPWLHMSLTGDYYLVPGSGKADNTEVLSRPEAKISAATLEKSVVVLPFKNLTGKPDQDYLVQGQNDALISELCMISQVKPLRVLSGQTASVIASTSRSIPEIANEINVDYIVEGSVLNASDSINLQLRLIQAFPDEKLIWAKNYKSDIVNSQKLYNNLAGQIAGKIGFDLTPENIVQLPAPRKINPATYATYLRGMYYLNQSTDTGLIKGIEYFNEVLKTDPADPFAYAGLAFGYITIAHGPFDKGDALDKAEAAAMQAIRLDTTMAEVYGALGVISLYGLWKFDQAEKYFKRALMLNPNLAFIHYHYSWGLHLWGRNEEAINEHILAKKADPFNPLHTAWLGGLYWCIGRNEEAVKFALESFEIQKDYPIGCLILGLAYKELGKTNEAIDAHKKLAALYPEWLWALGYTYAITNHREEAEKILHEIESQPDSPYNAYCLVVLNGALGNKDEAFKWLNYEPHHGWVAWVAVEPWFKWLRDDPRYDEFVRKLNLPKK